MSNLERLIAEISEEDEFVNREDQIKIEQPLKEYYSMDNLEPGNPAPRLRMIAWDRS